MHRRVERRRAQRLDHVLRRPDLRVPATEVNERRPGLGCRRRNPPEQGDEVLIGEPLEAVGTRAHPVIVFCRWCPSEYRPAISGFVTSPTCGLH